MRYVTIANTKIQVLEYEGKRVMTSAQVNQVMGVESLTLNYGKSVKAKTDDFIRLPHCEGKKFLADNCLPGFISGKGIILWGESAVGLFANYACKSSVMRELREKYFNSDVQTYELVLVDENDNEIESDTLRVDSVADIGIDDGMVDGRRLHAFLQVETPYTIWFERMCEYGFVENVDFNFNKNVRVQKEGGRNVSREIITHSMTIDMAKEISMIQRNERGKQARQYFIECEKRLKAQTQKPMTQAELIAMQANALVEYEREQAKLKEDVKQIKEQSEHSTRILQSRIDTLNGVCTEGTPRQKLKSMVDLYAIKNGLQYGTAWREFVTAYNTAYKTNLKRKMKNYMRAHGIKKMTTPEYLEAVGKLDDAMRVADKMLNPSGVFNFDR
jgi:phage anti-repressor protein